MNVSPVACPRCKAPLPATLWNLTDYAGCPGCQTLLQMEVFPALFRRPEAGTSGELIVIEGESSCFYHPHKKAITVCVGCGRFLCGLCDCQVDGQHFCPACLETGRHKGKIQSLERHRVLFDTTALRLSVTPVLLTALAALFITVRHWKAPSSIIPRSKIRFILAIVFSVLQIAGWAWLIYYLIYLS